MAKEISLPIIYFDKKMVPTDREHAFWQEQPVFKGDHFVLELTEVKPKAK